jgi:hypothetical protein
MTPPRISHHALRLTLALTLAGHLGSAENLSTLTTDQLTISVDLDKGGAISLISSPELGNVVNNHDLGRQIQMSYYSGPVPFSANGQSPKDHWKHLGWNPIQAGDDFKNGSRTEAHSNDGREIYTRSIPLQWPLNKVEGECRFESWIRADGNRIHLRCKLTNQRADKTSYDARPQECPAVYTNGSFHRVVSYIGDQPFTQQPIQTIERPKDKSGWAEWNGTEFWSATLDDSDRGLGLIRESRSWFTGGFDGKPGTNDTHAGPTAYVAGHELEKIDHDLVHEYRVTLVLGSLTQIRTIATELASPQRLPGWTFANNRQGWHSRDVGDPNPNGGKSWSINPDGPDPQLISPQTFWRAEQAPFLEIDAAFSTTSDQAHLFFRPHGTHNLAKPVPFKTIPDGARRTYRVRLADSPEYQGGMLQLRLDPVPQSKRGDRVDIFSVRLTRD